MNGPFENFTTRITGSIPARVVGLLCSLLFAFLPCFGHGFWDHFLPGLDVGSGGIGGIQGGHLLDAFGLLLAEIVLLGTILCDVVEFPWLGMLGDQFPVALAHGVQFIARVKPELVAALRPGCAEEQRRHVAAVAFRVRELGADELRERRRLGVFELSGSRQAWANQCLEDSAIGVLANTGECTDGKDDRDVRKEDASRSGEVLSQ